MNGKFDIMVPAVQPLEYSITGTNCQVLNVNLKSGKRVDTEPGAMLFKSPDVKTSVECGACQRVCVGESMCKVIHTNEGSADGFVGLTPAFPAKVVPVDLSTVGGKIITKSGAYMASTGDVRVSVDMDCNCCTCCCGGMGLVRQSNIGNGTVFLAAGGTVLTKTLGAGESMLVDTSSLVGYQEGVKLSLAAAGGCCTLCCGGEGLFNTKVEGPGLVIVQSMSFEKYRAALAPPMPPSPQEAAAAAR